MNKWLFKWHSRFALLAFLPLLVICVTGSVLVFKHEIDALLMPDAVRVAPEGERLGLGVLEDRLQRQVPDHEVVGWALFQDPGRTDLVYVIPHGSDEWHYVLVDPYSGQLRAGPVGLTDHFTDWLLALHYMFLIDDPGLVMTSVCALMLCFLGITGLVLHRRFWRNFFTLRWRARLIVYFSDLHKMIGVVASPVLLVLGITGGYWNIMHVIEEIEEHAGGAEHHVMQSRLYSDSLELDGLLAQARESVEDFEPAYITFPYEPGVTFRVFGDVPEPNPLISQYASMVAFDPQTGARLSTFDIRDAGFGARLLDSFRRLHFGDFGGLPTRIFYAVVGLSPLVLAVTGLTLWAIRRRKVRQVNARRAMRDTAEAA